MQEIRKEMLDKACHVFDRNPPSVGAVTYGSNCHMLDRQRLMYTSK